MKFPTWLLLIVLLPTQPSWADHLPKKLRARTQPEHVLATLDVYGSQYRSPSDLMPTAVAKPSSDNQKCLKDTCGGEEEVTWTDHSCSVSVFSMYRKSDGTRSVYAVAITQRAGDCSARYSTGRGLSLGSTLQQAIKLYGNRFFVSRVDADQEKVVFQWTDDTTLEIELDKSGVINTLRLTASVE